MNAESSKENKEPSDGKTLCTLLLITRKDWSLPLKLIQQGIDLGYVDVRSMIL